MRGIKEFSKPTSLEYALKVLHMHQGEAMIVAGGTHLALLNKTKQSFLVDINNLGLNYVKEEGDFIKIGATTRAVDILNNDLLKNFAGGVLPEAASNIGSVLTRNLVTIGGNVYTMFPWSNFPPALLVLDACVELTSLDNKKIVSLQELLRANTRKTIEHYEFISAIFIPKSSKTLKTSYKVFNLTKNDYDIVIVVVALEMDSKVCKKAKIALGAAVSPCDLLYDAAQLLEGKELTSDLIVKSAEKAVSGLKLISDFRTTDEHRLEVIKTLVKRALEDCKA